MEINCEKAWVNVRTSHTRSCSVAAGTVGINTKQGLLEKQPAVEATGTGSGTLPLPTVNIDFGL